MPVLDPRNAHLPDYAAASAICEKHSLWKEWGSKSDIEYLEAQIKRQAGPSQPLDGWILHVSLKMEKTKLDKEKLQALASEVGERNVDLYLVAALLYLMDNYGLIRVDITSLT